MSSLASHFFRSFHSLSSNPPLHVGLNVVLTVASQIWWRASVNGRINGFLAGTLTVKWPNNASFVVAFTRLEKVGDEHGVILREEYDHTILNAKIPRNLTPFSSSSHLCQFPVLLLCNEVRDARRVKSGRSSEGFTFSRGTRK